MHKIATGFILLFAVQLAYGQSTLFRDNTPKEPVKLDGNMTKADFVPGVILVRFKDAASISAGDAQALRKTGVPSVDAIFREFDVTSVAQVFKGAKPLAQKQILKSFNGYTFERPSLNSIYKLTVGDPLKQFDAIQALKNDSNVVYAEPDYIYSIVDDKPESGVITPQGIQEYLTEHNSNATNPKSPYVVTPNDPLYSQQWAIPAVHADAVWDTTTGDSSQIIAFLDTGVDWHHPDLAANIWTNTAEADGVTGVDDDNDGYVDDVHGWDFINNDNDPSDDNSHGTHVAGIACAVGDNGIGIAGVDWHAKIMPIKVFQSSGRGDVATITQGIYYAVMKGATVTNMSFGSYARSLTMETALQYAYAQCVLVAAAGNDHESIYPKDPMNPTTFYPAALPYVLGVQAWGMLGGLASFSNYDPDGPIYSEYSEGFNYEMLAPGEVIISTVPGGNYRVMSGTSMATPMVSGAVALYFSKNPNGSREELWGDLIHSSDLLNAFAAIYGKSNGMPKFDLTSYSLTDTLSGDDGDGQADAGETIQIQCEVRNTWVRADSAYVKIRFGIGVDSSGIQILNRQDSLGSISPYGRKETTPFDIHVGSIVTNARNITLDVRMWCQGFQDTTVQQINFQISNGSELSGLLDTSIVLTPDRLWLINNSLRIGTGDTITILPGTHVVINAGVDNRGFVRAIGTKDSLIAFDGGGFGNGIYRFVDFNLKGASLSGQRFENCMISSVGGSGLGLSAPVFKNCTINGVGGLGYYPTLFSADSVTDCSIVNAAVTGVGNVAYLLRNNFHNLIFIGGPSSTSVEYNNFVSLTNLYAYLYPSQPTLWSSYAFLFQVSGASPIWENSFLSGDNVPKTYAVSANGSADVVNFSNQYWGTTDSVRITKDYYDFWEDPGRPLLNVYPILTAPSDSAHGIVWKVLVDGVDPQDQKYLMNPIGVGPHRFDVYFNRPMDTTVTPQLSFGVRDPFNQQAVTDSARWSDSARVWTAYKTVKLYTGDGINTIRVAGAKDPEGFEIPVEDMRFSFLIDAAGTESVDFAATPGLGKVQLDWMKPDLPDILGYNMYRFNNTTDTTYSDTTLISTKLITDTTYTDFNVTPGTNYYYAYKVVRTDFTESDFSKFVGTKALTSIPGDANGDFTVNVLDVIADVSYIMGQNPQPFIFAAADVNTDSVVNVLDVIGTINLILHPGSVASKAVVASLAQSQPSKEATIDLASDKVWLNSPVPVYGLQLTIAGCKDASVLSNLDGLNGLEVSTTKIKDDTVVVLAYSMKGNFILQGKVALVQSNAKGITLVSAVLSSADGKEIASKLYNNGVPTIPEQFTLFQNYPNPFNPTTTIRYGLPKDVSGVQVVIYDILGRQIRTIKQGQQSKGYHEIIWDGRNRNGISVASGVYFCQFRVREGNALRIIGITKMMMLK